MKTIITIGRQLGSGGKEIGIRVSKELGIPFYDLELLQEASKSSGLNRHLFDSFDEKPRSFLYAVATGSSIFGMTAINRADELEQQVYLAMFHTIQNLAEQGPCVFIGRCADYALSENPNLLRLFIYAPMEARIKRVAERQNQSEEQARTIIHKTDRQRAAYYDYYTGQRWGAVENYDFCLNSSFLGTGGTVELIRAMVEHRECPVPSPTEDRPPD